MPSNKPSLDAFLKSFELFEPVEYNKTPRGVEICLGRVDEGALDVWLNMIAQMLMAQRTAKEEYVSISKQYFIKDTSLVYLWKIVCRDIEWFAGHIPRIDKTLKWQKDYTQKVDQKIPLKGGGEKWGEAVLPSVMNKKLELGPQPEEITMARGSVFESAARPKSGDNE